MTPEQYENRVKAQLDALPTQEKDNIILGLIEQLYPEGKKDTQVQGGDFVEVAADLLAAFHPDCLSYPPQHSNLMEESDVPEF